MPSASLACNAPTAPGTPAQQLEGNSQQLESASALGQTTDKRCCEISLLLNEAGQVVTQYGDIVYGVMQVTENRDGTLEIIVRSDVVINK